METITKLNKFLPPLPERKAKETIKPYPSLTLEEITSLIDQKCAPTNLMRFGSGRHNLVHLPEAWNELKQMIYFGKSNAVNHYEQQYQGMGHIFIANDGVVNIVVTHYLYIYSANRGTTHATVLENGDTSMLDRLQKERDIYNKFEKHFNTDRNGFEFDPFLKFGTSEVVLFGHTHPNLGVFFSPPDYASSYATSKFPAATFVCDPIRKELIAMVGVKEETANILVYSYSDENSISTPTVMKKLPQDDTQDYLIRLINEILKVNDVKGRFKVYRGIDGRIHTKFTMKRSV